MFRFENTYMLYFLFLLPILVLLFHLVLKQKKKAIAEFGESELMQTLMPTASKSKPVWKFYIFLTAIAFIILGLARPQFGSKLQEVKRKGVEIMIALDVSNSMNATDIQPSRLERAKQVLAKLVDKLTDDKIGLIVFAGDAYTQIPITTDYVSAKMYLNNLTTGIVPVQGTAIGKAINLAESSFPSNSELQKVIIIITDGENHEDDPVESAKKAYEKGILVYTLGMGLPEGAPIPEGAANSLNFKKDQQGNTVMSKLDEITLQKVAVAGGGEYIRANNSQAGLNNLFSKVDKLNKKEYDAKIFAEYDDQYQYFFGFAILLLLIDLVIAHRKSKFLLKFRLFEVKNIKK
jgi:Ca-activated chloride channel family protein